MEIINHNKILALLNDKFECARVGIINEKIIMVKSPIDDKKLIELIEFVKPLHYCVRFGYAGNEGLAIVPNS